MPTFLEKIIEAKKGELVSSKYRLPLSDLKSQCRETDRPRDFLTAIRPGRRGDEIRLIAEIKKASPSKGMLLRSFDPLYLAEVYAENGASALSVLTEKNFFLGDPEYLRIARSTVALPVLRKDFLFTDYHLYESRIMGADAVLLIARILEPSLLADLIALASDLGMASLVEIHHQRELVKAEEAGAMIIGINNRDLDTFQVDIETSLSLLGKVRPDKITVSESGISSRKDVERLREAGADAILVGEAFLTSGDIPKKIKELTG